MSHNASSMALGMAVSACWLIHHFGPNISTTIGWIVIKFCTDVHGSQRMNPTDFGDPLTFSLAPPAGQSFHLSCEISQYLLDGLA